MAVLTNPRHERFAQELAKGKTADEAYRLAGYQENRGNASTLKANQNVLKRVAELQERVAVKAEVTAESLIAEAEEIREKALAAGQYAAAVAAVKEKGVLSGVRVEKLERKSVRDVRSLADAELDALIADLVAREEGAKRGSGVTH